MIAWVVAAVATTVFMSLYDTEDFRERLNMKISPTLEYKLVLVFIMVANFIFCYVWEVSFQNFCLQWPASEHVLARALSKHKQSQQNSTNYIFKSACFIKTKVKIVKFSWVTGDRLALERAPSQNKMSKVYLSARLIKTKISKIDLSDRKCALYNSKIS